jgi:uncharacterized membrane protein
MSTTDTTLLIILTSLLSIFVIVCIAVAVVILKLVTSAKQVVIKAEAAIDSVESAAEIFKNVGGKVSLLKLIRNIVDTAHKKSDK